MTQKEHKEENMSGKTNQSWLEKILEGFRDPTIPLSEEVINTIKNLVENSDVREKELCSSELSRYAKLLFEQALSSSKKEEGAKNAD